MLLALGAIGAGTGLSAYSSIKAGDEAARAGKEAAKVGALQQRQYNEEARITQEQSVEEQKATLATGQYESREKRKEATRVKASRIAQVYAQGGTITGSNLINIADEATEYEADAGMIMHNYQLESIRIKNAGNLQATKLRNAGKMSLYQGQVAKYQGYLEKKASRIRALSTIASGVGTMAMLGVMSAGAGGVGAKTAWAGGAGEGTGLGGQATAAGTMYT